jgi:hypothetical protein
MTGNCPVYSTAGCSAGVNSSEHRFGAVVKYGIHNGVQKCLNPESDQEATPATQIVNKAVEDARTVGGEYLGTAKRLGAGDRNIPADFCFGKPTLPPVCHALSATCSSCATVSHIEGQA